jgi:hypothetical protein
MTLPPSGPRPVDPRTSGASPQGILDPASTVERALDELDGLGDRPLTEHVAVFEQLHAALGDALSAGSAAGEAAGRV